MIIPMTGNSKKKSPDIGTDSSDKNIANDDELQTGYIQGNTFDNKEVKYRIINGWRYLKAILFLLPLRKR
jgi:hypothetical protein